MPTYQYACTQCDERLEAVQSFSDAPLTECPVCGGRLRKVFSAVGVVFKGSGFYKTDSRSSKSSSEGSGSAGGKEGGSKDGAAKEPAAAKTDSASNGSGSSGGSSSTPAKTTATPAAKSA